MPGDHTKNIAEIVDNLIVAMPVIHRKLISNLEVGTGSGLSHHHFAVLGLLSRAGALPVSEISKRLWISRPQMTAVIEKLVNLELVARQPDGADRRVIHIALTPAGQSMLNQIRAILKSSISQKLASLTEVDLQTLAASLGNITRIGSKIE